MKITDTKFNLIGLLAIIMIVVSMPLFYSPGRKTIDFKDPNLERAVRNATGKFEGELTGADVDTLEFLDAKNFNIKSLVGIEQLINLQELNLENNFIDDVSPLKNNIRLRILNLQNNEITSLEDAQFENLIYLHIRDLNLRHNVMRNESGNETRLTDINVLGKMLSLRKLDLRDNHVDDLTPLANLRRLTDLDLRENKITDIESLSLLTRLEKLNLRANDITSIEPLRYLHRLTDLNIHSADQISDISPLQELHNLETLIMRGVKVDSADFLKNKTKLTNLNALNTGLDKQDKSIIEAILKEGALQGDVRPVQLLSTLEAPTISKESGLYQQSFSITIESAGDTYYTTDGSEPSVESNLYEDPIKINDLGDNIATVLRFKTILPNTLTSPTISRTYFVSDKIDERFTTSFISIMTDPDNLFDDAIGIYHKNNYEKRGSKWERPVQLDYFEEDGTLGFSQCFGVRVHGGATRALNQKSLRLRADNRYDENSLLEYDIFGTNQDHSYRTLILRNGGNDWHLTLFGDAFMQSLAADVGTFSTQESKASAVFINGQYHGIYYIVERYDDQYFKNHYDIEKEELVVLKSDRVFGIGEAEDADEYTRLMDYIEENDIRQDEHYRQVCTMMDMDSFIDYYASQIYFANYDWPHNNIRYWRKTENHDSRFGHDGKWRWAMYDTDFGFARYEENDDYPVGVEHNTISWINRKMDFRLEKYEWPTFLFYHLIDNDDFKNDFITRFCDLLNTNYQYDVVATFIDDAAAEIETEIGRQVARWGAIKSKKYWLKNVNKKYKFAEKRPSIILKYFQEEFELDDLITVTLSNESSAGHIRLNSMDIDQALPGNDTKKEWSGQYFGGLPITLEAVAKEGYVFSHWEGLSTQSSSPRIELSPTVNLNVSAVFIPE